MGREKVKHESGMFSAGHLTDPQARDPRFEKFDGAVNAAITRSKDDDARAMAHPQCAAERRSKDVPSWEDDSGEILVVVYQQQVFTP
jgi:hypothetical protein